MSLPSILRRRISAIGQLAFRAAYALSGPRAVRFIFCSRHGEFERTLRLVQALAAGEPASPAEFSLSVHNALAGLLSIAWSNTAGHSTISAGADTFGAALLEAAACLKSNPGEPVMLVYFDDRLPEPYDEIAGSQDTRFALALLLNSPHNDSADLLLTLEPRGRGVAALSASGLALDFLRFLLSAERERRSMGERIQWRWQRGA